MPSDKDTKVERRIILLLVFFLLAACSPRYVVIEKRGSPPEKQEIKKKDTSAPDTQIERSESKGVQYGVASWYGGEFHGRATSSGEIYDMYQLTCAHNTLPLGTTVMVTNLENGRSLELKVNDRGPFVKERIIDLSYAAAQMLGIWAKGTAPVKVEVINLAPEPVIRYSLQVGSFTDEINAQKLAEQLRRNFENVQVATVETPTEKYHRVRIGQFDTREAALGIAEKLSQMGLKVLVTSR